MYQILLSGSKHNHFFSLTVYQSLSFQKYLKFPYAKQLLEKLLPTYDVKKKKLGGSLPRTYMVTEGPMAGYFS